MKTETRGAAWVKVVALAALVGLAACGNDSRHAGPAARDRAAANGLLMNPAPDSPGLQADPGGQQSRFPIEAHSAPLTGVGLQSSATASGALVLYDTTGPYGYLGELYAMGAANLVSHFGAWTAKPVMSYTCGEIENYAATIYLGSTYDEPLPACFLDNVMATRRPVLWSFYNIWQLVSRAGYNPFTARFGWTWKGLDFTTVSTVRYKNRELARYSAFATGILATQVLDPTRATVLATSVRSDGTTFPWAIRGDNLTFVGEIPFSYMSEEDRYLVFADLLFDALAPATTEQHRALVRLEDIGALEDPAELRAIADYLFSQQIPFGFGLIADYRDPHGVYNDGVPLRATLRQQPALASALKYLVSKGGVPIMHGDTHQWAGGINPYSQVSGDDTEFYRFIENPDHSITYAGPLPEETTSWATARLDAARAIITGAGLAAPTIFEFPHYAGSVTSYRAIGTRFTTRWERALYFRGLLGGGAIDHSKMFGQLFPYVVRDIYGAKVLPENLGNIEPTAFYIYPPRSPADLIRAAEKNLVVRDGFASFYFHPFFDINLLRDTVAGIRALGYTFVSPSSL